MKVAIGCGGTGGHIFPGVAVGVALRARGHEVTLWLGGRRVEALSTCAWDGAVVKVKAAGFPSGISLRSIGVACRLLVSIATCWVRMRRERPDVLLAMGSYASVGPGVAARLLGVPLVLHESNAVPGRAVLLLSRCAAVTALGFSEAADHLGDRRTAVTGFPLRGNLAACQPLDGLNADLFTILVMGGSQGAHRINEVTSEAICEGQKQGLSLQVIHLTGSADESGVRTRYETAGVPAQVYAFLDDMGAAYAAADLAIARAGAASCAELAACRVPALLVPLPTAARDHQRANAATMAAAGGVDVMDQCELSVESLLRCIDDYRRSPDNLAQKRQALAGMAIGGSGRMLCELIEEVAT